MIFLALAIEDRKRYNAVITTPYITAPYWNIMYITCKVFDSFLSFEFKEKGFLYCCLLLNENFIFSSSFALIPYLQYCICFSIIKQYIMQEFILQYTAHLVVLFAYVWKNYFLNIFALHPASLPFSHLLCLAHRMIHLITPLS